jgi:hypothetical protein
MLMSVFLTWIRSCWLNHFFALVQNYVSDMIVNIREDPFLSFGFILVCTAILVVVTIIIHGLYHQFLCGGFWVLNGICEEHLPEFRKLSWGAIWDYFEPTDAQKKQIYSWNHPNNANLPSVVAQKAKNPSLLPHVIVR